MAKFTEVCIFLKIFHGRQRNYGKVFDSYSVLTFPIECISILYSTTKIVHSHVCVKRNLSRKYLVNLSTGVNFLPFFRKRPLSSSKHNLILSNSAPQCIGQGKKLPPWTAEMPLPNWVHSLSCVRVGGCLFYIHSWFRTWRSPSFVTHSIPRRELSVHQSGGPSSRLGVRNWFNQ